MITEHATVETDEAEARAEIRALEARVRAHGEALGPEERQEVAQALVALGRVHERLEEWDAARARYAEVVRRLGDAAEPALTLRVAEARLALAWTWVRQEEIDRAREAFEAVVRHHGEAASGAEQTQVAEALVQCGVTLVRHQRPREARGCCEEVVRRFGGASEPALRKHATWARLWLWALLRGEARDEEARGWYAEAARGFEAEAPEARQECLEVFNRAARGLSVTEHLDEARVCLDEVVRHLGEDGPSNVDFERIVALTTRAQLLRDMGRLEEGLEDMRELARRARAVGSTGEASLVMAVQRMMGAWLKEAGRLDEARGCYAEARQLTGDRSGGWETDTPGILLELGLLAEQQGHPEDALDAYAESVRRFDTELGLPRFLMVTQAHHRRGLVLCGLGRFDEARACFQEMMRRYGAAPDGWLREQAAIAHFHLGLVYRAEEREQEAVACLGELLRRQGGAEGQEMRRLVLVTRFNLGELCTQLGRPGEARGHYEALLRHAPGLNTPDVEALIAGTHRALAALG